MLFPIRRWLERLGRRKGGGSAHPGFTRTGAALWVATVDAGAPTLAAVALHLGAQWGGLLSREADVLAGAAVVAVAWAAGILALGRVLATEKDAGQRLLPLPDDTAKRVRPPLRIVAVVTGAGLPADAAELCGRRQRRGDHRLQLRRVAGLCRGGRPDPGQFRAGAECWRGAG
ncbi:MAG: hypothetical protein WDM85_03090 [Caulobacteraceae bacterium]